MDNLKRNEKLSVIKNNTDGGSTALKDIIVLVPIRYMKLNFLSMGATVKTIAIMAVIDASTKQYKTYTYPSMISFQPFRTETLTIEGEDFYGFHFRKGDPFAIRTVVQSPDVVKPLIEDTLIKGNIPFYINYEDCREIFYNLAHYCGSTVATDETIMSVLTANLARTVADTGKPYRLSNTKTETLKWIGINNVGLSRRDGFSQMTGAYMREGLTGAALRIADEPTEIEEIMK